MSLASGRSLAVMWLASACAGTSWGDYTWLCDADADISPLELRARQVKGLLQPLDGAELDIAEALWFAVQLVLDNAHVCDVTAAEEVIDVALGGIEGQVA